MTSFAVKENQNFVEVRIQGGYEKNAIYRVDNRDSK